MNVDDLRGPRWKRVLRKLAMIAQLRARAAAGTSVTGEIPLVVSLTSYGPRLKDAALAIEAIGAGSVRPQRLILWVAEGELDLAEHPKLAKLQKRGLEIIECADYRSFKKIYPYAIAEDRTLPMVTADDDIMYPREWLKMLWEAHRSSPDALVGLRAHKVAFDGDDVAPYSSWKPEDSGAGGYDTFFTSGHGIVVLPKVLDAIRDAGTEFMESCLHADDIWLYVHTVASGVRNKWIVNDVEALGVPGSQAVALHHENVSGGRNDGYLQKLVTGEVKARVLHDAKERSA